MNWKGKWHKGSQLTFRVGNLNETSNNCQDFEYLKQNRLWFPKPELLFPGKWTCFPVMLAFILIQPPPWFRTEIEREREMILIIIFTIILPEKFIGLKWMTYYLREESFEIPSLALKEREVGKGKAVHIWCLCWWVWRKNEIIFPWFCFYLYLQIDAHWDSTNTEVNS